MICDSKKMANRVAIAGALKMNREGYTFVPFGAGGTVRNTTGSKYFVCIPTESLRADCTCKFFAANWEYATCKHTVWAKWQADAAKEQSLRDAEEDRIADDAAERMFGREAMESDYLTRKYN